jgi:flagellar hook-associated protein 3 FlgL
MKISTNLFFDRATSQMVSGQQKLAESQYRMASGKKVNNASDAPDEASSLRRLQSLIAQQQTHQSNIALVTERLQAQDVSLRGVGDMMQRLRELAVQYTNGTLSADQRRIAAIEVKGIGDQILSLANGVDSLGNSLFAGSRVKGPAFSEDGVYLGDQTTSGVPVGSSRLVTNQRAGDDVFRNLVRQPAAQPATAVGFFKVIEDFTLALQTNDVDAARAGIDELAQIHEGVTLAQAKVGTDLSLAQAQSEVLSEQMLQTKSLESDLQDLDYAEAVSQMQKQIMSLEAAQNSFAKISGLSLFQYL